MISQLTHPINSPSLADMFEIDDGFSIMAGPCSIESIKQMESIAQVLKQKQIKFMRGGAYKPRTSPYDFQGLGIEGLKLLKDVCKKFSLLSVSEILDPRDIEKAIDYIDVIQIGSRSMPNTALLKEVGKTNHPILLKRGMMSTLKEFLLAAEYIACEGNKNIILCERGIRTIEDSTRNTLDISSVAIIKKETSLSVIIDLSHSLGRKDILLPIANAVIALGVDGIMLEVHDDPSNALSDSKQQLSIQEFEDFYEELSKFRI
ncbi:MAG: bifunctional 3-deoxy-7-phosphoheptulonate synthase/chorismate mutase [Lachnospiraceae bacterium]|nr:bifunctional 3-deoxy-7-phosphoheptulonate synthase/chorismate mutase [Lachnospiraceae bacterium]